MVLVYPKVLSDSVYIEGNALRIIRSRLRDERGQGLVEYTLLIGFLTIVSTVAWLGAGNSVGGIWTKATQLIAPSSSPLTVPNGPVSGGSGGSGGSGDSGGSDGGSHGDCHDGHGDGCH
jgi:Flp pilus assembly pilin Flp